LSDAEVFGNLDADRNAMFLECINQVLEIWNSEPPYNIKGQYWNSIIERQLMLDLGQGYLPKPLQKPHPPIWMACSQLDTIARAGQCGFGALGFQFVSADAAHAWVHAYYNAMTKRLTKLADYVINPNIALVSFFMCAKTDEEARRRADGATFFQFALRFYGASADRKRPAPGTVNMWDEYNAWKRANPDAQEAALRGGLIGSPETIRRKLAKFETSHIDQVILLNQAGKNTHEHICESLELFA
jgi:alkanesulfonate monooxygenase SsuD/methylene tetrahydromethanopterin reductase-like flavin-dependent oxidoreductase (luciferase family)